MIVIPMNPFAKPRMTRRDKWAKRPAVVKYRASQTEFRYYILKHKIQFGDILGIAFVIEMPKSWSKKKRLEMDGKPHQSRPDLDNMIKAIKDSLFTEDSHIWKYDPPPYKIWGQKGQIIIQ